MVHPEGTTDPAGAHATAALQSALARLDEVRDELARRWLVRVIEDSPLDEIGRLDTERVARELPGLISDLLRGLDPETHRAPAAREAQSAALVASLRGGEGTDPAALVRDFAALQAVIVSALGEEDDGGTGAAFDVASLLTSRLGGMLASTVSEVMAERSREFESIANTDALTGIYNLRFMNQHVRHLVGVQRRYGHPFAVLVFDVDGLKRINDAFGHAAGDRALIGVATAVRGTIRAIDTPVRMGGDEFCVLAPHQTTAGARVLGERISHAAEGVGGPWGGALGVSVGVVSCPEHAVDVENLFELADEAMYRSKASGTPVAIGADRMRGAGNGVSTGS